MRDVVTAASRVAYERFDGTSTTLIGDTPLDVAAALATGARAVDVAAGSYGEAGLSAAGAHAVLSDLTDAALVLAAVAPWLPDRAAGS